MILFLPWLIFFATLQGNDTDIAEKDKWLDLVKQHEEFRTLFFPLHEKELLRQVKEGQTPRALMIGCSDSRFVPDLILGAKPGDLFQIRVAGNFVPIYTPSISWDGIQASIQYAVDVLKIEDIIVCGHSHCGAIQALFKKPEEENSLINHWINFGLAAKVAADQSLPEDASLSIRSDRTARISVILQLQHLLSYPFVRQKVAEKKLFLHGWYYILEEGKLLYYDPQINRFVAF